MKTSIEWLVEQMLVNNYISKNQLRNSFWLINEAEEMHKQEIINTCYNAQKTDFYVKYYDAEQYYNETFNK
jgi:hypothetical protein